MSRLCDRPLVVRCGAFGDMVLVTALIGDLSARFGCKVDILTSGPWSEPLLTGQSGVGDILCVRSRKTPYWLSLDQQRTVHRLRSRGVSPTWFCDGNDAARPMLVRAGFRDEFIVDAKDHPLFPGEHATQQWRRLARILPAAGSPAAARPSGAAGPIQYCPTGRRIRCESSAALAAPIAAHSNARRRAVQASTRAPCVARLVGRHQLAVRRCMEAIRSACLRGSRRNQAVRPP